MKFLITGANGQVGMALRRQLAATNHTCIFTDIAELNLRDEEAIERMVLETKPTVIINCAAYTAVDKAERETQIAVEINQDAVRVLAEAATLVGATLLHLSTDYVYHNDVNRPLKESDPTHPQSVYARTKLAGEKEAFEQCKQTIVIRTSWVYGLEGHNFLRTMLRLAADRDELNIVCDQIGAPTFAEDIAKALIYIAEHPDFKPGLYNFAGQGVASWYDFAKAIFEIYDKPCKVNPIGTSQYPTPAKRPHYSVMDLSKAQAAGLPLRHWRDALYEFKRADAT